MFQVTVQLAVQEDNQFTTLVVVFAIFRHPLPLKNFFDVLDDRMPMNLVNRFKKIEAGVPITGCKKVSSRAAMNCCACSDDFSNEIGASVIVVIPAAAHSLDLRSPVLYSLRNVAVVGRDHVPSSFTIRNPVFTIRSNTAAVAPSCHPSSRGTNPSNS